MWYIEWWDKDLKDKNYFAIFPALFQISVLNDNNNNFAFINIISIN